MGRVIREAIDLPDLDAVSSLTLSMAPATDKSAFPRSADEAVALVRGVGAGLADRGCTNTRGGRRIRGLSVPPSRLVHMYGGSLDQANAALRAYVQEHGDRPWTAEELAELARLRARWTAPRAAPVSRYARCPGRSRAPR